VIGMVAPEPRAARPSAGHRDGRLLASGDGRLCRLAQRTKSAAIWGAPAVVPL